MKGFRFHPTDEELIDYYLRLKILGHESLVHEAINEINICRFDPSELPGQSKIKSDDQLWYFFSSRVSKYPKGKGANRRTKTGYWKVTGKERKIKGRNQEVIGSKKTLVFYKGCSRNAVRTPWVMHEYFRSSVPEDQGDYVICKVQHKLNGKKSISPNSVTEHIDPPASCPEDNVGIEVTFEANSVTEHTDPPASCREDNVGIEVTFEANSTAEESPPESVSDFRRFDGDLDEVLPSLDMQFPTENNSMNDPPCSQLGSSLDDDLWYQLLSSLDDPNISDKPMTQSVNSLLYNSNETDCENFQTHLHSQMESQPVTELDVDGNFDSSRVSSSETSGGRLQETSPILVNMVQPEASCDQEDCVICKVQYKLNGKKSISPNSVTEHIDPPASCREDNVGIEVTFKANNTAEESPPESVFDFSWFDGDLDEVFTSLDMPFPTENNSINDPPCSQLGLSLDDPLWYQFLSSLEEPNISDKPKTQSVNSLFYNSNESDCENFQTHLHSQMESEPVTELDVDGNFDSSPVSSSETSDGRLRETSPILVNVVQPEASCEQDLCQTS